MEPNLLDVILALRGPRVMVLGDVMLDRYTWGRAARVSPEAPVLVLKAESVNVQLGGAGGVACLIQSLEGHACLSGVVGSNQKPICCAHGLNPKGVY